METEEFDKYQLNKNDYKVVKKLPQMPKKQFYSVQQEILTEGKLYVNENEELKLVSYQRAGGFYFIILLQLFLKKYRSTPELLPALAKSIKKDMPKTIKILTLPNYEEKIIPTSSIEEILLKMQIMLTPMNTYNDFKEVITKATKEIKPLILSDLWGYGSEEYNIRLAKSKYGSDFIFLNSKEEMGIKKTNINGDEIKGVPDCRHFCIYHNKENNSYEVWRYIGNDDSRGNPHYYINVIFYEEKYLYEYLLNLTLEAVDS